MPNLTMLQKGLIVVVTPFLVQLALVATVAFVQGNQVEAEAWSLHSKEVIAQSRDVLMSLVDGETSVRGFAITGNPISLMPFDHAAGQLPANLVRLVSILADNPSQQAQARQIAAQATALLTYHRETIQMIRDGNRTEATDRIKLLMDKQQMDALRDAIHDFDREEERLNDQRRETLQQVQQRLRWSLIAGTGISLLVVVYGAFLFFRGIIIRIRGLTENVRRLAEAKPFLPMVCGKDEVAQLDHCFRDMVQTLATAAAKERAYQATLEQRVAERTAELAKTNRDLAQKNQENEVFVYSVSHDLRSPLVNLQGFSKELSRTAQELRSLLAESDMPQPIRDRGVGLLDGAVTKSIRFIQTAVTRLSNIIDALLRLSRAGRVVYQRQRVDVQAIVARVVDSLKVTMEERGATIQISELPPALGDPTALEQVFANLIGNALNFLDGKRPGHIEVGSMHLVQDRMLDGLQTYNVRDNGLGIPDPARAKVFQPFQRLHPLAAPGEGMGLTIVQRVVERHGGSIWFESVVGQGSTFFVSLPAFPDGESRAPTIRSAPSGKREQPT